MTKPLIHPLTSQKRVATYKIIGGSVLIILFGILSGYQLSKWTGGQSGGSMSDSINRTGSADNPVVGVEDDKTYRDSTEGTLEAGGINGEGTHKLIRPGGDSQTVYLTSSVLDLSQFEGKQVRVWGETNAAQKAGWLMDVGKVELLQ